MIVKEKALQLGYSACGIIPANIFEEFNSALDDRLKSFPNSEKLYGWMNGFGTPPEGAKSIIVCIRGFSQYKIPPRLKKHFGKYYLFHSDVAYGPGFSMRAEFEAYLQVAGMGILNAHEFPIRWAAVKAGLGKFGYNNFFYTPQHGSYNHIDAWVVNTELDYDEYNGETTLPECNRNCKRCVAACPSNALEDGFSMDYGKCLTYLMFEQGLHTDEVMANMGEWLYGCDACQDICPANNGKLTEEEDFPLLAQYDDYADPKKILDMDNTTYTSIINPRFNRPGKDGLLKWKCNALRALINAGAEKELVHACCKHSEPSIRKIAEWGMSKN